MSFSQIIKDLKLRQHSFLLTLHTSIILSELNLSVVKISFLKIIYAILWIIPLAGTGQQIELIEKKIKPSSHQKLNILSKTGGMIEVEGWEKDFIYFKVTGSGSLKDKVIFLESIDSTANILTVKRKTSVCKYLKESLKIDIKVPLNFYLDINSTGGDVLITNLKGRVTGKTLGGDLSFANLDGEIDFKTYGGNILVEKVAAKGMLKTYGGDVRIINSNEYLQAETSAGKIIREALEEDIHLKNKAIQISKLEGDIDLRYAPEGAILNTLQGDINLNYGEKNLHAKTLYGDINIKNFCGNVSAITYNGNIDLTIPDFSKHSPNCSSWKIVLKSTNGDVKLKIPKNFSFKANLDISYSKDQAKGYKVFSDFDIDLEHSNSWIWENNQLVRKISGDALLHSGNNKINLSTVNGDIYLYSSN